MRTKRKWGTIIVFITFGSLILLSFIFFAGCDYQNSENVTENTIQTSGSTAEETNTVSTRSTKNDTEVQINFNDIE